MDINKRPHSLFSIIIFVATIVIASVVVWGGSLISNSPSSGDVPLASQPVSSTSVSGVEYKNNDYGFSFALPESWSGYAIVTSTREIRSASSGNVIATAPTIRIRHPLWTKESPREDIPIDVYTLAEWQKIQSGDYSVGAAPIPPSELGRNSKYVFALPARYNYDYLTGWEEVQKIIDGKPLHAFEPGASSTRRYSTKEQCENATGKRCDFEMCDINCSADFVKGWQPIGSLLEATTSFDTSTWKTYQNNNYLYKFEYPPGLVLKEFAVNPSASDLYDIGVSYISPELNAVRGAMYCEAYTNSSPERCEVYNKFVIDWNSDEATINDTKGGTVRLSFRTNTVTRYTLRGILSTFKFTK